MECGIYIGDDLNGPNDNLTFTCLFKRPELLSAGEEEIARHLHTFEKYMTGERWSLTDYKRYFHAFRNNPQFSARPLKVYRDMFRVWRKNNTKRSTPRRWGWKEPNTQVFLEHVATHFDDIRYIQVVRHGLDMAFSSNRQQLELWNEVHDIEVPEGEPDIFVAQLEYWIKANKRSLETGKRVLGEHFLQLNYEDLCSDPERVIPEVLDFLGIAVSVDKLEELFQLPRPTSRGRYKNNDNSIFPAWMIDEVRHLGFDVDF